MYHFFLYLCTQITNTDLKLGMRKEIQIHNRIDELQQVAAFTEGIAEELGLGFELTMNLNLVLEEMVSNVIFYAYPKGTDATIGLLASSDGQSLTFELSDHGRPFDPTACAEANVNINPAERQIGGMGIYITKHIMDEVTYRRENNQNILTMRKLLK